MSCTVALETCAEVGHFLKAFNHRCFCAIAVIGYRNGVSNAKIRNLLLGTIPENTLPKSIGVSRL